jgi:hypothetical protein
MKHCPLCDAEYADSRERCTVCGVELVSGELRGRPLSEREKSERIEVVWRGGDPVAVSKVVGVLREAEIRHHVESTHDYFVFGLAMPRPKYVVRVFASDAAKAKELLAEIRESAPFGVEETPGFPEEGKPALPRIATRWNPAAATTEIWSGEDAALAEILEDCLRENRIGVCREGREPGTLRLCVMPADESAAREIVREVLEATPPA